MPVMAWNTVQGGGADFQYAVATSPTNSTTAWLAWATGYLSPKVIGSTNDIFSVIPHWTIGRSGMIDVPEWAFKQPPPGAKVVLLVLDPEKLVLETS